MDGLVRYVYRPFDNRWLYWEGETRLLGEKSADYKQEMFDGNLWLEIREKEARPEFSRGTLCRHLADNFGNGLSNFMPAWLRDDGFDIDGTNSQCRPNLSLLAQHYLDSMGLGVEDLFHHVIATLHDPQYRTANAGALRMEWPRIRAARLARRRRRRRGRCAGRIGGAGPGTGVLCWIRTPPLPV